MPFKSQEINLKQVGVFGLIFLLILYFLVIRPHFGVVKIQLYINTDHPGVMEIFPPLRKLGYSQENARAIGFPQGESGHIVTIKYTKTKANLRLDPTVIPGRVIISKMSMDHLGFTKILSGLDFKDYVVSCEQAICKTSVDGLLVESTGTDSKVILRAGLAPLLSSSGLFVFTAPIVLVFLAGVAVFSAPLTLNRSLNGTTVVRWVLAYLVLYYFMGGKAAVYNSVLSALAVTSIIILAYPLLNNTNLVKQQNVDAVIVLFFASLILLTGLSQSFTAAFIKDVREELSVEIVNEEGAATRFQNLRSSFEGSYTKHFFAKDLYINLDAKVKIFGLGFTPNAKSILGRDGWYFEGYGGRRVEQEIIKSYDNITDYMGLLPFDEEELEAWRIVLEERYYWLKERGIDYVFVLAPTKALVYPEKLPARIFKLKNRLGHETRYEQLVQYIKKNSVVPIVDLKSSLQNVKEDHPWPLYYRTDFHWNYLGSYYAYEAIMDVLDERYPQHHLETLRLDEFRIEANYEWAHHNFLKLAGLNPTEHQDDTYLKLFPKSTNRYDDESVFYEQGIFDGTMPGLSITEFNDNTKAAIRELKNDKGEIDSIFIIGDSFSEKMAGYFSANARLVYNYRTVSRFLTEPINLYKPQIVIQEILNMYILGAPPVNPPELKAARMKYIQNTNESGAR